MSRIYVPRRTGGLEVRTVAQVLDQHFGLTRGGDRGVVHNVFGVDPWITYDAITRADLALAAELYWPAGGWRVVTGWRASADGASSQTTSATVPAESAGGAAAASAP